MENPNFAVPGLMDPQPRKEPLPVRLGSRQTRGGSFLLLAAFYTGPTPPIGPFRLTTLTGTGVGTFTMEDVETQPSTEKPGETTYVLRIPIIRMSQGSGFLHYTHKDENGEEVPTKVKVIRTGTGTGVINPGWGEQG